MGWSDLRCEHCCLMLTCRCALYTTSCSTKLGRQDEREWVEGLEDSYLVLVILANRDGPWLEAWMGWIRLRVRRDAMRWQSRTSNSLVLMSILNLVTIYESYQNLDRRYFLSLILRLGRTYVCEVKVTKQFLAYYTRWRAYPLFWIIYY